MAQSQMRPSGQCTRMATTGLGNVPAFYGSQSGASALAHIRKFDVNPNSGEAIDTVCAVSQSSCSEYCDVIADGVATACWRDP